MLRLNERYVFFISVVAISVVSFSIWFTQGLPQRMPEHVVQASAERLSENPRRDECFEPAEKGAFIECKLGSAAEVDAVLWGDSHSDAVFSAFSAAANHANRAMVYYGLSSCPPSITLTGDADWVTERCLNFNKEVYRRVVENKKITDIYMSARWSADYYKYEYVSLMCGLVEQGLNVYALTPVPVYPVRVPGYYAKALLANRSPDDVQRVLTQTVEEYEVLQAYGLSQLRSAAQACGVKLVDPLAVLCKDGVCESVKEDLPIYSDENHLSERGAVLLVPMLSQSLKARGVRVGE